MLAVAEVGAYEAKTHLADLLREVQGGREFTITHRGVPVADLVPTGREQRRQAARAAGRMRRFMESGTQPVSGAEIKALIEEGRD